MWSKLRRNVRAHKFRLKMCGATQYNPNRSKSTLRTFDRGCVFVAPCSMFIARAHMQQSQQLQQQSSSQREGWRFVPDTILPISGHPSGSWQGHPRYTGARSAGRPWVARTQFSTAVAVQKHPKTPPDGYMWSRGKITRKQLTSRPDHLWPELWGEMGKNAKLK